MIDPNRRAPTPENDPLEHDLVARVARGAYIDQTLVKTPAELIEEAPKEKRQGELGVTDVPTTLQKLHDHLVKIAPVLQT